ncbi:nucleolar complex protein 2 homolog [Phlebotomus argentipes]|uniref:nucleolar complex protein 2 homolog n=1 Tax=Phlebotomus argentipes TaxID=94469 RepID=UPI0028932720|nr:nucleolar complex protein 2 homolog [Phlebotomus argentipes]
MKVKNRLKMGKKKLPKKSKKSPNTMTMDSFLETMDNSSGDEAPEAPKKAVKKGKKPVKVEDSENIESMKKLQQIDPEFYEYLRENDKDLLNFNADDISGDAGSEPEAEEASDEEPAVVQKREKFEVASDESDFEEADEEKVEEQEGVITLKMLKSLEANIREEKVSAEAIRKLVQAFNSALRSISPDAKSTSEYRVKGSGVFNGVIQLCVLHLHSAIWRFLALSGRKSVRDVHKLKRWSKMRNPMRSYTTDLTHILENVSSPDVLTILLKHLHQMVPIVVAVSGASKPVLKRLVSLWSSSEEETVRVLAFLCILKLTRAQQGQFLSIVLKVMYLSYVRNSRFVSPTTLPGINFMRRSLAEMFALDAEVAYQHAFLYIRQLAIHLRNAVTLKRKDSYQAVYNWQYINALRLWGDVLSGGALPQLLYPLVTIIQGVIKLIPTAQWFPLRFHCIHILIALSRSTRVFIPVLPFILEVLQSATFNKKHSQLSLKALPFTCILRVTRPQLEELSFRTQITEHIFATALEYLASESYSLTFPDLVVPTVILLRQYIKRCSVASTGRKLKQLLDLTMENFKLIEAERKTITFSLRDAALIHSWETQMQNRGTPLLTFYTNWLKTSELKKRREADKTDEISDFRLPTLKRRQPSGDKEAESGPVDLLPSDSDEEELELEKPLPKKAKKVKALKQEKPTVKKEIPIDDEPSVGVLDVVEDLDIADWLS